MRLICSLKSYNGEEVGEIEIKKVHTGVEFKFDLYDIPEGFHQFMIHEFGDVSNPKVTLGKQYKDLGNIFVSKKGIKKGKKIVSEINSRDLLGRSIVLYDGTFSNQYYAYGVIGYKCIY